MQIAAGNLVRSPRDVVAFLKEEFHLYVLT